MVIAKADLSRPRHLTSLPRQRAELIWPTVGGQVAGLDDLTVSRVDGPTDFNVSQVIVNSGFV